MKLFSLVLILCFPLFSMAATGYEQVEKLFNDGALLDLKNLRPIEQGMYVGRCFQYDSSLPLGAFATFKDVSKDSGPIQTDPELYVGWGAANQSDYYDSINVSDVVTRVQLIKLEIFSDDKTYEYNHPYNWVIQYRQHQNYIVQRNQENGIDHSYCYYYQFRNR